MAELSAIIKNQALSDAGNRCFKPARIAYLPLIIGERKMKELFYLIFHFKLKKLFVERTDNTLIQFFRSVFVSGIATLFDFGMTAVVREVFIGNDTVFGNIFSNSCGFMVGLAVNFALSCIFVFSKSKYGRAKEFMSFALIGLVGLGINNLIVYLLGIIGMKTGALFYIAKIIATLITFIWNFSARKFIIYRKENLIGDQRESEAGTK